MIQKIVVKNGKKYIVNTAGWNDDVGPGAPNGTLWMQSTDGNWYSVNVTGTSGSAAISINQTPVNLFTNDIGYQLLYSNNNAYQVYLSGSSGGVTLKVNTTPWIPSTNYKPWLNLKSTSDGNLYQVYLSGSVPAIAVNQNSKISLNNAY